MYFVNHKKTRGSLDSPSKDHHRDMHQLAMEDKWQLQESAQSQAALLVNPNPLFSCSLLITPWTSNLRNLVHHCPALKATNKPAQSPDLV